MFLDVIDIQILNILKENSRLKLVEIGSKLNLTPATIKNRIDRLVEFGIIDKFTILINRKKAGYEISAFIVIYAVSKFYVKKVAADLKDFTEISKISILMGDPDILAEIDLNSMHTLIQLLTKISQIENIQTFKTWFVQDVYH